MMEINELLKNYGKPGRVVYISVRPERLQPVTSVTSVEAVSGIGLQGDRHKTKGGKRQVTLIQSEHIKAVSAIMGKDVHPDLLRRNIVVEGINLLSLKGKDFKIGEAVFRYSGECHPCSRMETNLGTGGYNAMRGHGGITAQILEGGQIKIGDSVAVI